jgi:hypothetical protein
MERKLWSRLHSPALSILGAASAAAGTDRDRGNRELGNVVPCSLVGVNPGYCPEVFGNAGTAYAYGFVRSWDGAWCDPTVVANGALVPAGATAAPRSAGRRARVPRRGHRGLSFRSPPSTSTAKSVLSRRRSA